MMKPSEPPQPEETITVAGVTFSADEVKSVIIIKDGRLISIGEVPETKQIGFQ